MGEFVGNHTSWFVIVMGLYINYGKNSLVGKPINQVVFHEMRK